MSQHDGSAAAGTNPAPESANIEARRAQLREQLSIQLKRAQRTLELATAALNGPDPEAALVYLEMLDERLQATLTELR